MAYLVHIGTPHQGVIPHSGRYPWGSGNNGQGYKDFQALYKKLRAQGLTETEIAKGLGLKNTSELRAKISYSRRQVRASERARAIELLNQGYSKSEIAKMMGKPGESSIRSLLDDDIANNQSKLDNTINMLRSAVDSKRYVDIGAGTENHIGVSDTMLKNATAYLKEEGYKVYYISVPQPSNPKQKTSVTTLCAPDVAWKEVNANRTDIKLIQDYTENEGRSYLGLEPIRNIESKRVAIRYSEDGGADKDGMIELRRGVPELNLGASRYAQVRIGVDGTHFIKGMAVYSDDMPDGIDILFNTNKGKDTPMMGPKDNTVLKVMKDDPDNPFTTTVRQKHYIDANGKQQLSALNNVGMKPGSYEEGGWDTWSKSLSSQFLSKQNPAVAKRQLDLAVAQKKQEFDDISKLTNPVIKRKLMEEFADGCDSDAVHLKAAAMPRQTSSVLLGLPAIKENEIYAPNYKNGEKVVLIRYPHAGIFEIPTLTVNNNNPTAKRYFSKPPIKDAVVVNPKTAQILSGADFDGDSVLVIPNNSNYIRTSSPLRQLANFDPKSAYPEVPGMKVMGTKGGGQTGQKMGDISNLITDMTVKGYANDSEIARAVKHSMVVIDAEKHRLNYMQSYLDNDIAGLKQKYQGGARRGASTLISRASSQATVLEREEGARIGDINPKTGLPKRVYTDPNTGEKLYEYTGATRQVTTVAGKKRSVYSQPDGSIGYKDPRTKEFVEVPANRVRTEKVTQRSTKMYEAKDARDLITPGQETPIEGVYANYANSMKSLGNQARKTALTIPNQKQSTSAKQTYASERASLITKLQKAESNSPLERQAIILANAIVDEKREQNPDMDSGELKKIRGQALASARFRVGAGKERIKVTDREWEAIQAGAISGNQLSAIINNMDNDTLKQLASPREKTALTSTNMNLIKAYANSGFSTAEIAEQLGISVSSVKTALG